MTVTIVWSLRDGVLDPPQPHKIDDELLAQIEAERQREIERKDAERFVA